MRNGIGSFKLLMLANMVLGLVSTLPGQELRREQRIMPRFGIEANIAFYPQGTAKEALESAAKALQNKRYEYIVAHMLDPEFVQLHINDAAARLLPVVEKELDALRAAQKANPASITPDTYVPVEPQQFTERVEAEANRRAFLKVVGFLSDTLTEAPENAQLLGKYARSGVLAESGDTATVTLKNEIKKVYLKQGQVTVLEDEKDDLGRPITRRRETTRWYIEDRQLPLSDAAFGK